MKCTTVKIGDVTAIVCSRKPKSRRCTICGRFPAVKQCDYPTGKGTCDKHLCAHCAVNVGPDRDFCRTHPKDTFVPQLSMEL